ncbi:MAG: hypothetical protein UV74_C0013G0167 [Candidatus Woesebacteria bacterium GW2011_GWB1_43_14]|uniref:Type 4 fimbrial biogenesis protein PilX N-terminal domain-containing protein n=1 Tax=Candidatus Woesebacteria bacterium GW2011_GWB1_43_14 TaxID=1618578 RepID=A0A0G1DGP1_9BACT|nr:MAG: hypothetical protein UV51_C0005G0054 [Candidatus Woesebacteria bacterium GW2011_GWC1_42_9]KKS97045.1 MAG: hypothetical protein UV74_C0013G0167 [Candidatus Woesebacteria bacterium GW2011_GWB1_43_14]
MKNNNLSGQALLFVLLAMAVVATLVLSAVSRSISDVEVTTVEEDSLRAFNAAEAGVEQALVGLVSEGTYDVGTEGASYQLDVKTIGDQESSYNYPFDLSSGSTGIVWFVSHDADENPSCSGLPCYTESSIRVCWGLEGYSSGQSTTPAVEVAVLYDTGGLKIARAAYDPNNARVGGSGFSGQDGQCTAGEVSYAFSKNISFADLGIADSSGLQLMSVRMLYNDVGQPLGVVTPGQLLPSQGNLIESTGISGDANRRVQVYALYATLPSLFESAIATTSSGGIIQ